MRFLSGVNHGSTALGVVCIAVALGFAVFYQGDDIRWLSVTQVALLLWLATVLAVGYAGGLSLPLTPLSVSLALFWLWLALSLLWTRVPLTSQVNFWWVGTFVLVFWTYTLAPRRELLWRAAAAVALLAAVVLCAWALLQVFISGLTPRASFINPHSFAALLMLVALPLAAYLLNALAWGRMPVAIAYACVLALLFFTIALTRGRGTAIALALALAIFVLLHLRRAAPRHLLLVVGLWLAAYAAANLVLGGALGDRFATLAAPEQAVTPRLLIWSGAWQMALQHPWLGIGLGTYYQAWPPFRDPSDQSLGFYVHNDYLQLWIETGLPGVLLLLVVLLAATAMFVRYCRRADVDRFARSEAIGLWCGLAAVAAHSFVDFNFYILSISLLAGLALGRLHQLMTSIAPMRSLALLPAQRLRPLIYRLSIVVLVVGPTLFWVEIGVADVYFQRGLIAAARGDIEEADRAYHRAEQLAGFSNMYLTHADMYRAALSNLPADAGDDRRLLYEQALALLARAVDANPYAASAFVVRGRLYEQTPDLAGADWRVLAGHDYRRALQLNPRFYLARVQWAQQLLTADEVAAAREVLESGLAHWYDPLPSLVTYYELAARVRRQTGDGVGAAELAQRVAAIQTQLATLRRHVTPHLAVERGAPVQSMAQ